MYAMKSNMIEIFNVKISIQEIIIIIIIVQSQQIFRRLIICLEINIYMIVYKSINYIIQVTGVLNMPVLFYFCKQLLFWLNKFHFSKKLF